MHDTVSSLHTTLQRTLMSGALLTRFVFVLVGAVLIAALPWPYGPWPKVAALTLWILLGVAAARALRIANTEAAIKTVSRALLTLDTLLGAAIIYCYMPIYHDAWAFVLFGIVFGSTQDRSIAAIATGCSAAAVVIASYFFPASPPAVAFTGTELAIDLSVIVMMTTGIVLFYRSWRDGHDAARNGTSSGATGAPDKPVLRDVLEIRAERMQKVVELAVTLVRERELGPLLDRILDVTTQTFGFRCGAIMTAERDREVFAYRSVRGYGPEQTRRLMVREVPFAQANIKLDPRFLIRGCAYYAPVERQSWHTDPLACYRPEAALLPRERRGAWHEADTLLFTLTSSEGAIIGLLCPDAPVDGLVPSDETIDNVALFARLAAAAIENVYHGSMEPHRELARAVARTLDLATAIFTERDLDALLHRILETACESFGFNAGTILLRVPGRDAFVRKAAVGYPGEVEGAEITGSSVREMMSDKARVRDSFYYAPMEMNIPGGITRNPNRAILPRVESGQWHENDLLLFPIFDSQGRLIGVLTPDDPKNRRVPEYETIQMLETFARIAGLAIETALIRTMAASSL
jgi:uncharacterized protein YigA (DUF484 family)